MTNTVIYISKMANSLLTIDDKEYLKALNDKLDELADNIFADSQDNIVLNNLIDEGTLLKSGTIKREFLEKEIIYSVPYASAIEFGRTPGTMPPVQPIADWVKRKGIARTDAEAKSIAWAIAKDIKINGQLPRPFLGPAIDKQRFKLKNK